MSDFDFSDINLDFLQSTPPKNSTAANRVPTPIVKAEFNHSKTTKPNEKKRFDWAKKIASVDQCVNKNKQLRCENLKLQADLKNFQKSALEIQSLYTSEKRGHEVKTKALQELQQKYEKLDTELVVKSLKCEQFEACLADKQERPVDYNELAVKYLRIVHKLEGEEGLKGFQDRSMVEGLKQYCAKYKLKLFLAASPKKPRSRTVKIQKEDVAIQCDLLQETPAKANAETKSQATQCQVELRSQGTQHISTMTTRSTTTSCFIKFRNVATNFPETQSKPGVDDILKEFAPWQNITPISPLIDQLQISEEARKTFKTIGTCTWLCNIRRSIDFIPRSKLKRSQSSHPASCDVTNPGIIKQEVTTPSPSPTPNVPSGQNTTSAAQVMPAIMPSQNMTVNPLISTLSTTSQLSQQVSSPSFHELWHIFGRMILGLLQTTSSNAGIAATNQEAVNQQQFHNWLRELYDSSVAATTAPPTIPEQTVPPVATNEEGSISCSQTDQHHDHTHSVGTSPLRFNEFSLLTSSNIVRPQARRSFVDGHEMNAISAESDIEEEDVSRDVLNSHNSLSEPLPSCNTIPASSMDNFNCDSNSTLDNEIPYLHLISNPTNTAEEELQNSFKTFYKPSKRQKHKHKILDEIQELFPEVKLSKDKQKALKRLLKPKKLKKKSSKKSKQTLTTNANMTSNDVSEENGTHVETAVDFLKGIIEKGDITYIKDMEDYADNTLSSSNAEIPTQYENIPKTKQSPMYNGNFSNILREDDNRINNEIEIEIQGNVNSHNPEEETHLAKTSQSRHETVPKAEIYNTFTENITTHFKKPSSIDETFSFTKPAEKSKKSKSKYSNKKELYNSLFGDSDTELDESEIEEKNFRRNIKNNITFTTADSVSVSSKVIKYNTCISQTAPPFLSPATGPQRREVDGFDTKGNFMGSITFTQPENIVIDSEAIKTNSCSRIFPNTTNVFDINTFDAVNQSVSIPEIATPILQNIEESLMSTKQPMFLFDGMDKEHLHRLDTIIDNQLEKIPHPYSSGVEANEAAEDFPSDFEKDFELPSEEECAETTRTRELKYDDCELPSNTFTITNELFSVKTMFNETNQCERDFQSSDMDIQSNSEIYTHSIKIYDALDYAQQSNSSMNLKEEPNQNMKSNIKLSPINAGDDVNQLKCFLSPATSSFVHGTDTSEDEKEVKTSSTEEEDMAKTRYTPDMIEDAADQRKYTVESGTLINSEEFQFVPTKFSEYSEVNTQNPVSNQEITPNSEVLSTSGYAKQMKSPPNTKIEERHSTTSTEEECSIIEISSDITDIETTRDVSTPSEELMSDEYAEKSHKELAKPPKLIIKEEIVFYVNNIPANSEVKKQYMLRNSDNSHEIVKNSETVKSNSSNLIVAADVNFLGKSPASTASFSFVPVLDTSQMEPMSITTTEDERRSIIKISSNITEIGGTRDVTTPTDELMIDEDVTDNHHIELGKPDSREDFVYSNARKPYIAQEISYLPETTESTIESPPKSVQNSDDSLNTSTLSSILNSSLYKDILSDSLCPIVEDILHDKDDLLKSTSNGKKILRCGRKRKSESQPEVLPPCKRSERIKAKKIILEQTLDKSLTPVEIGKYTRVNRNSIKVEQSFVGHIKKQPTNQLKTNEKDMQNITATKIGFFREIYDYESGDNRAMATDKFSLKPIKQVRNIEGAYSDNNENKQKTGGISTKLISSEANKIVSTTYENSLVYGPEKTIYRPANQYICHYDMRKPSTSEDGNFISKPSTNCFDTSETVTYDRMDRYYPQTSTSAINKSPSLKDTSLISNPPKNHAKEESETVDTTGICFPAESPPFDYSESPQSPQNEEAVDLLNTATFDIPLEISPAYRPQRKQNSLLESLISLYSPDSHNNVVSSKNSIEDTLSKRQKPIFNQYNNVLKEYCCNTMNLDPDIFAVKLMGKLQQQYPIDYSLLYLNILKITKEAEPSHVKESELPSIIQEMPPRHMSLTLQRLFYLLKHLQFLNNSCCSELILKIESHIFNCQQTERMSLDGCLHITQLYLISCKLQEPQLREHPARLFIAKCLYCYSIRAVLMIHEVLMWYPSALPHREDPTYDRSDAMITVIQHCLMCYKYDMEKPELRGKALISKLRYEYHYEPYKPSIEEVACNLVEKLKSSKFTDDISFAFSIFCKRLYPIKTETSVLQTHLVPLANEYFNEALQNANSDIRISALLEIISIIIKPFPLEWNMDEYLNLFSRFLNAFNRKGIQEAAVCSILRLQRFGYVNCFNRLSSFKPTYELESRTQAMFKTFVHRRKLSYLKTIQAQNPINLN